jgi:hypothetical protein
MAMILARKVTPVSRRWLEVLADPGLSRRLETVVSFSSQILER